MISPFPATATPLEVFVTAAAVLGLCYDLPGLNYAIRDWWREAHNPNANGHRAIAARLFRAQNLRVMVWIGLILAGWLACISASATQSSHQALQTARNCWWLVVEGTAFVSAFYDRSERLTALRGRKEAL